MKIFSDTKQDAWMILVTSIAIFYPFILAYNYSSLHGIVLICSLIGMPLTALWHFNTTMHYHIHRKIFTNKTANRILEAISTIPMLISYEEYKTVHLIHHKYVNDPVVNGKLYDPTSTFRNGKDGKEESFLSYIFIGCVRYIRGMNRPDLHKPVVFKDYNKLVTEHRVKLITIAIIALINISFIPVYFALLYFAWVSNSALTYSEHHNAVAWDDPKRDSCSCYGRLYNFLTFNSGYHQEHHFRPGAHWKQLPELRKELPSDRHIVLGTLFNNNPFTLPFSKND